MMSYSRRSRYSRSPVRGSRSQSSSFSRSRSVSRDSSDVENPGNNLYVTGLSPRITKRDLEKHFSSEGTVIDVHLVVDPWTRESRGFGFVTMSNVEEADRCIKYLHRSVLEGRVVTVEKAKRRRGRTPTPGRYLGVKTIRVRRRSPSYSPYHRSRYSSPRYSAERDHSESPYYRRRRYRSRSRSYSRSPSSRYYRRRDPSYSPYYSRSYSRSPSPRYYRRHLVSHSPYYHGSHHRSEPDYYNSRRHYHSASRSSSRSRSFSRSGDSRGSTRSPSENGRRGLHRDYTRGSYSRHYHTRSPSVSYSRSVNRSRSRSK